jgi:hypothetical protein
MLKAAPATLRRSLADAGYRVQFRTAAWCECLVQRDREAWDGRGRTEDDALGDALSKMLPSHLARAVFEAALLRHAPDGTDDATRPTPIGDIDARVQASSADVVTPPATAPALVTAPLGEPESEGLAVLASEPPREEPTLHEPALHEPALHESGVVVIPTRAPEPAGASSMSALPGLDSRAATATASPAPTGVAGDPPAAPTSPVASSPTPTAKSAVARAPSPVSSERVVRMRASEALEAVEKQMATIEERVGHLARMSADRQRLFMMVWICRARSIEEAFTGTRDVEQAVARVARRLTDFGKMFWPGSVRALQLSARPADVRRELHASFASDPANWREATVLAERLLEEHLAKSNDAGLDEDGWADGVARTPRHGDPDALLAEIDAELKTLLAHATDAPSPRGADISGAELERVVTDIRKLRWIRGAVRDDLAWGVAIGRARRAVQALGERGVRLREALDHRTKPSTPWAKVLGEVHQDQAAPSGESPDVLRTELPAASVTKEGLLGWLIRAFDVINTPDLVALLVPLKGELDNFGEDTLNHSDRRVRRRLRELVKRVAAAAAGEPEPQAPKSETVPRDDEPVVDDKIAAHALDELASRVRGKTEGRRALFVSNREDPELGARLTELLGIDITWCDGSLRRVQAQCERIKGGGYDLILSATGFQVHGVDGALSRAASAGSVPYVRVNRGRPVACVQAIAREFGLFSGTYRMEAAKASSDE